MSESKNPQLHELLAVEQSVAETANRVVNETTKTLSTKQTIFTGMTKSHEIFAEESQHLKQATEYKEVQSTVKEQLDFAGAALAAYWDVTLQKEEANQRAFADIVVNGQTIASDVPSIVLLGMEKKLTQLLGMYNGIPTLDAAKAWEIDPGQPKPGIFRTKYSTERQQTETVKDWKEISPATQHHKAQNAEISTTNVVGKYIQTDFSSAISSYDKAEKLARLTALIRAVKKARQRANNVEVNTELTFGKEMLNFING